jgi:hypothetical protein
MVVGQRGEQNVTLREPLNPPSGWTKFKAALSSVPLLGQMGSLQRARQEVDSYPVKLGEYEVSNRQILSGFVKDLRENYGEHVAGMALRGMDVADGAPLSQRMVKTAMDNVEQAQKQQRAMNNMQITRFLESPLQGGARLRGEVDMTDICLERNMPLNGQPSWQQALGTEGAKFVSKLTEGLCRKLPDHSRQALTNEQIAAAAHQALDTYQSLLATPGMTPAKLENLLMRANEKAGQGHEAVLSRARELAVTDRLDVQLNRKDPESLINSTATRVLDSIREENNGVLPPGLDLAPVLKSIANGISETVSFGMDGLPQELGCDKDTPSIAKALDAVLPGKIEAAIRGHVQALAMIQQSTTLTPSQKEELTAIAQTRRIDPVQVQKYEAVARTFNDATAALKAYAEGGGSPQAVFARLEATLSSFENEVGAMKEHGATMWEHGSLSGGDMTTVLMQQLADVAVRSLSPEDARALRRRGGRAGGGDAGVVRHAHGGPVAHRPHDPAAGRGHARGRDAAGRRGPGQGHLQGLAHGPGPGRHAPRPGAGPADRPREDGRARRGAQLAQRGPDLAGLRPAHRPDRQPPGHPGLREQRPPP